jgi:Dyp-type peroxidase family
VLDLTDIQGIIVYPYPQLPYAKFAFLQIKKRSEARNWLREVILPRITTGDKVKSVRQALNIGFTYQGLKRFGLGRGAHTLPREFREGMSNPARSRQLGDTGKSAPGSWDVGYPGQPKFHLLMMMYGETREEVFDWYAAIFPKSLCDVLSEIYVQDSFTDRTAKEPFGYRDGISQPHIDGVPIDGVLRRKLPGQDTVKPGEFLLGHVNEYDYVSPVPTVPAYLDSKADLPPSDDPGEKMFGHNGSYLVWRKLEQDVEGFNEYLSRQSEKTGRDEEWVAARLMGRWRSGAPLILSPDKDNAALADDKFRNNNFYYSDDHRGLVCPIASHIRRANPRDELEKYHKRTNTLANRHRIIRRGRRYEEKGQKGLLFMAINADIGRQFEFVQQSWLNNAQFSGLYNDKDPIASDRASESGSMAIPRDPVRLRLDDLSRFVHVKGGGYFFLPSRSALKFLARDTEAVAADRPIVTEPGPDEERKIKTVVAMLAEFMRTHYPPGIRPARRQAHAKTHGVVKAEFHVLRELPVQTRHGVFEPGRRYEAWVRFSNASSFVQTDTKEDVRGMAIKLMGIDGGVAQDFLLINSPVFFSPDADDFIDFLRCTFRWGAGMLGYASYILRRPFVRLPKLYRVRKASKGMTNPLTSNYWSTVPYRLGSSAVKYIARPWQPDKWWRKGSSPDFLREAMAEYLNNYDARFDFMVQFQTDPATMPIDDSTIEWNQRESPYVKVATIRIPKQTFDSPEQIEFGENLSFAPWHSLRVHQPIGQMNRIRREAYKAMSELRHAMNGVPQTEPDRW